jgi:hypothetical protein
MRTPFLLGAAVVTAAAAAARASVRRTPDDITGEVAIVTGASRGQALARELGPARSRGAGQHDAASPEPAGVQPVHGARP